MTLLHRHLAAGPHTCPWWFGYSFDNPLRRLVHDPAAIVEGLVTAGDTVADIGCGLGYFTIGLARVVGERGRVIAIDLQPEMIRRARRRVKRNGLAERVDFRVCAADSLGLTEAIDFALAFWMVHESRDQRGLLAEVKSALRPGGHLLIVEPKLHVSDERLLATREQATAVGFQLKAGPKVRLSNSILCTVSA